MILSTIDIGTNTILMVTAQANPGGAIQILGDEHAIARLGKGVDASRTILPETFGRVADFLLRYRQIAEWHHADRIVAFGTSALRDARNQQQFIAEMAERTGITIQVLSGQEEAQWTYRGALFGLAVAPTPSPIAVLDIGGGSTEIAVGDGTSLQHSISLDIGAVRLAERCFSGLPPSAAELSTPANLPGRNWPARSIFPRRPLPLALPEP
ncbi:MAG: exopolyphosphatase [Chlorobi bacterium OLB7]|nr:MAG: exopolyphosphatase [Chlorobi bacterium OLB7]